MKKKIRVGVLFGGRSAEHEVSVRSARTVLSALNPKKYEVVLIGIDRQGQWFLSDQKHSLLAADSVSAEQITKTASPPVALTPTGIHRQLLNLRDSTVLPDLDMLFPVLHGPYGEDGTVQGLARLANLPCVGAGVLGSAVGMDKDVMKRLLRDAGVPIGKCISIRRHQADQASYAELKNTLGLPLFIKPANMGSSVGVSKVSTEKEYVHAMQTAFQYDRKVIVEEYIEAREIECSVLGNDTPKASVPGEIIAGEDFYSYDAKYASTSHSQTIIPAQLPAAVVQEIQTLAIKTFQVLECRGFARVDFFYTKQGNILVNEINTIPGFTSISMYPKLWEAFGLPLDQLVDELIQLAVDEHAEQTAQQTVPVT